MNKIERSDDPSVRTATALQLIASLLIVCMAAVPITALAWGGEAHRVIAEVAEGQLSAAAKREVTRLLALEPGATLSSVSTWADEIRSPSTASWHYVNFAREANCRYEAERFCVKGSCVVGAIERQLAVLASAAPVEDRLKALKYVVHFVADVHQPLHAGFYDDRGGNGFQLQAFGRGSNLHALWDSGLVQHWPGGAAALRAAVADDKGSDDGTFAPAAWAEQSCRIVATEGFYPARRKLDAAYGQGWSEALVQQMAAAARRLAAALNRSLGGP